MSQSTKTKEFLQIVITRHDGTVFNNDLTLSETHLISTILKENKSMTIERKECSQRAYTIMFGK